MDSIVGPFAIQSFDSTEEVHRRLARNICLAARHLEGGRYESFGVCSRVLPIRGNLYSSVHPLDGCTFVQGALVMSQRLNIVPLSTLWRCIQIVIGAQSLIRLFDARAMWC